MLTALLLSMTIVAPGDVSGIFHVAQAEADQPVKSKLVLAIKAVYPSAVGETVQRYYCTRDVGNKDEAKRLDLNCSGAYKVRVTAAEHVDLTLAEEVTDTLPGAPDGFADILKTVKTKNVPHGSAAWTANDTLVQQAFTGLDATDIYDFAFWRDKVDVNKIIDRATYFDVVHEATMSTLIKAQTVHKVLGRVP